MQLKLMVSTVIALLTAFLPDLPMSGALLLVDGGSVLARFAIVHADDDPVDLGSMTFLSTWVPSGKVILSNGEYREPAAPGSASEIVVRLTDKRVFGLVDAKPMGAVVLTTSTGGTGTFYDLALLIKERGRWVNTSVAPLGDRVKVHSLEMKNDSFVIEMTTHGSSDAMCCPTLDVRKRFAVHENRLVVVAEEGTKAEVPLVGTVWQWVETLYNNDKRVAPAKPANYTIRFLEDGKVHVKAGCNVKGGVYSTDDNRLAIKITHSTMAACEEASLEKSFVRDLIGGTVFFFRDDDLYIDLKYDTGTMRFSRQKE
jgi:heat shock protein HslJ